MVLIERLELEHRYSRGQGDSGSTGAWLSYPT